MRLPDRVQRQNARDKLLQWTGAGAIYRGLTRPHGAKILCYHSVAPDEDAPFVHPRWRLTPRQLAQQVEFLASERRVVALADLVTCIRNGDDPEPGTVAIAFDDGYRDNLTVAAPILAEAGLPATLFLPTAYIDRAETQWVDRLYVCLARRTRDALRLPGLAAELADPDQRAAAERDLNRRLIEADPAQREDLLCSLEAQLAPQELGAPRLTLDWDEVRQLVERYPLFDLGVHSVDHLDLVTHEVQAEAQLRESRESIARETGQRAALASFPFGRSNPRTRAVARELGFLGACADDDDVLIDGATDPYHLGRLYPDASLTLLRFRTSGAYPGLPLLLTRRT